MDMEAKAPKFPESYINRHKYSEGEHIIGRAEERIADIVANLKYYGFDTDLKSIKQLAESDFVSDVKADYQKYLKSLPKLTPITEKNRVRDEFNGMVNAMLPVIDDIKRLMAFDVVLCDNDGTISVDKEKSFKAWEKNCTVKVDTANLEEIWAKLAELKAAFNKYEEWESQAKKEGRLHRELFRYEDPVVYLNRDGLPTGFNFRQWLCSSKKLDEQTFFDIFK